MKNRSLCFSAVALLASLVVTSSATAQVNLVGEIILAPNESARGVDYEWPLAYVSLHTDGEQRVVDLTIPTNPVQVSSFNPAFGDQWEENFVLNGDFVSGHRFGGLNLWDVSGPPVQLDTANTTYHFDGLGVLQSSSQKLLLYSEASAWAMGAGLRVYDITNGSLTYLGDSLVANNQRDGRFLVATGDNWVYQLDGGGGSTRPLNLNVYDLANPNTPAFIQMFNMGNAVGGYSGSTDLELHPNQQFLYAACGLDGMRVLDIANRPNPVVVNTLSGSGVYVRELDSLLGTTFMVGSVRLPSGQWRFRVLNCANPANPIPLWTWFGSQDYMIHDLKVVGNAMGPMVLIAGRNVSGEATLQVWM